MHAEVFLFTWEGSYAVKVETKGRETKVESPGPSAPYLYSPPMIGRFVGVPARRGYFSGEGYILSMITR